MNRFITTALAALALSVVVQETPRFDPAEYAAARAKVQDATPEAPRKLRKTSPAIVPIGGNPVSERLSLQQAVQAFRAGWLATDPAGQPPVRWLASGPGAGPEMIGNTFTGAQIQRLARAVEGAPIEDQVLAWKLYGANQHLWRELQRLTAAQWDGPNDEPPPGGEADEPPGDGNDNGGGDPPAELRVYRINCGGPALDGWTADRLFVGGGTFEADRHAGIYRTERFGAPVRYSLPVTPGRYTVRLHMAELFWTGQAGRTFDVAIEGALVLDDFAPEPSAGPIVREFAVEVTDGALDIVATPSRDNASLCGVEVVR